jgi:N-methylhydantoinase A
MIRLAVDVGGTFTDAVAAIDNNRILVMKLRSTPEAPEEGFLSSVMSLLSSNRIHPSSVSGVVHVGTIGTNLFLGQVGLTLPKVALVTTRGFRDVLEIGRQNRPVLYDVFFKRPAPLVPRRYRFEVDERVDSEGQVVREISESDLRIVADNLRTDLIESVAVCFLNSYLNSANEKLAKEFIAKELTIPVFASVDVDPEHREYERTSTTVVNAALAPVVAKYLEAAESGLQQRGIIRNLQILSSSGGLVDVEEAKRRPILTVESGPAAGVAGAAEISRLLGIERAISVDMGGTSAKAGCILNHVPLLLPEIEVGGSVHMGRSIKGSGYSVRCPSIDLAEVSAGGGTIIWSDEAQSLKVGPISAGASPGPACYGMGGGRPTITDANLILGRIAGELLGGKLKVNETAAREALETVASKIGLDVFQTASAALKLINLHMAKAVHIVSLERGLDPADFTMIAFGGAGPMHAVELAEDAGIGKVIVPPWPGLFSALSMLLSNMRYTYLKGLLTPLTKIEEEEIEREFNTMTRDAYGALQNRGIDINEASALRSLDLRYAGQGYELEIEASTPFSRSTVMHLFEEKHESAYGYSHFGEEIEITALRLIINIPVQKAKLDGLEIREKCVMEAKSRRKCWFNDEWLDTQIYTRDLLPTGFVGSGPAIVEEYDSTVVIPPDWDCEKGKAGCLILRRQ